MPSPTPTAEPIEATLILLDLVNFSTQAAKAGDEKTAAFCRDLEKEIRLRAKKHKFTYIKSIGDAHLLFSEKTNTLAAFIRDFFNESRIDNTPNFQVAFRLLADRDAFILRTGEGDAVTDVDGSSQILLFRLEKLAQRDRALVTPRVFKLIRGQLAALDILDNTLELSEPVRGAEGDTPRQLHILTPPLPARLLDSRLPIPFRAARETLRTAVQTIPVFGNLYPAIPMAEDFLNLSLERHHTRGAGGYYRWEMPDFERRMGLLCREEKDAARPRGEAPPNLDRIGARDLFRYIRKGVIAGLPGAGKTTILRHFAYRALDADAQTVIAFAEAKHLLPAHLALVPKDDLLRPAGILRIVAALFLLPGCDPAQFTPAQLKAIDETAQALLTAWDAKRAIILLDALDEATGNEQRLWLSRAANELMRAIPLPATPEEALELPPRACFLTLRVAELETYQIEHGPLFLVNSLDMEQIRRIAARRYGLETPLYTSFDQLLPYRPDIQNIAGTPLTAMLMVFYFEVYRRFDTRHATYRLLVLFILAKAWERVKSDLLPQTSAGIGAFWEAVKQPDYFEREPEVALQYRALGHAATCILYESDKARKDATERSVSQTELAALLVEGGIPEADTAHWIAAWRRENFLLPAGPERLVPLHSTLFEFLAGEHIATHLDDKNHPSHAAIAAAFTDPDRDHLEVLPIACSAKPDTARRILTRLEQATKKNKARFSRESTLPVRCIIGAESIEAALLKPLRIPRKRKELEGKLDQPTGKSWAYGHLSRWFSQPRKLDKLHPPQRKESNSGENAPLVSPEVAEVMWIEKRIEEMKDGLKLERGVILKTYLRWWLNKGGPLEVKQAELLKVLLDPEVARQFAVKIDVISRWRPGASEKTSLPARDPRRTSEALAAQWFRDYCHSLSAYHDEEFVDAVREEWLSLSQEQRRMLEAGQSPFVLGLDVPEHPNDQNLSYYRVALAAEGARVLARDPAKKSAATGPDADTKPEPFPSENEKGRSNSKAKEGRRPTALGPAGAPKTPPPTRDELQATSHPPSSPEKIEGFLGSPHLRMPGGVEALAISDDGSVAVSADDSGAVLVWDLATGRELRRFVATVGGIQSCAIACEGNMVVTGHSDYSVWVWDVETGQQRLALEGHTGAILSCAVTPDGRRIVSGSEDKSLRVWDAETGQQLHILIGHMSPVRSCVVTRDGRRVVSGSDDRSVCVWDAETGQQFRALEGHTGSVTSCAVTPDGRRIVSGSHDQSVRVWDAETGQQFRALEGHTGSVLSCVVTPNGRHVVSGSDDKSVRVWDAESGKQLRSLENHTGAVTRCAVTPDGRSIVSASYDHSLRVWHAETGQQFRPLAGHTGSVLCCAVTSDGRRIVSASYDHSVRVWDANTGQQFLTLEGHMGIVYWCAVTPNGRRIVSASGDQTVRVWDAESGQQLRILEGHTSIVGSCAVTPDGGRIVSSSDDCSVRIWDAESGQQVLVLTGHTSIVLSCTVTPDGRRIVSGSYDHTVRVWDAESGKTVLALEGHKSGVTSCAVTPDGHRIVTGSEDCSVRVWDAETGKQLFVLEGHKSPVLSCVVMPYGSHIVSGSWDQTVRVWDLESGFLKRVIHVGAPVHGISINPIDTAKVVLALSTGVCMILTIS